MARHNTGIVLKSLDDQAKEKIWRLSSRGKRLTFILAGVFFFLFSTCTQNEIYFEFRSLAKGEWDKQEVLRFEVPVSDIASTYDVLLEVRNNNDYPFRNLWLFVDYQMPDGKIRSDTIDVELADIYGKWYGKGINLYTYTFPYEWNVQYPDTGIYIYTVRQGMRINPLKGISDLGLKILKKVDQ
jgi:gliding motility-associated lipoprotein GldH